MLSSPLIGKTGLGQVAASQIADDRVDRVGPEQEVEFGMERVSEEEFDHDLLRFKLSRQPAQTGFVLIGRGAQDELFPKLLCKSFLEPKRRLIVKPRLVSQQAAGHAQFFVRQSLHTDQQAATMLLTPMPIFHVPINGSPAAQVEVPHAEVRS